MVANVRLILNIRISTNLGQLFFREIPDPKQIQVCSNADIVIVPIEVPEGLSPQDMARLVRSLEPRMVIPTAYQVEEKKKEDALNSFINEVTVAGLKAFLCAQGAHTELRRLEPQLVSNSPQIAVLNGDGGGCREAALARPEESHWGADRAQ